MNEMHEECPPWEQQPGEPAVWFARFAVWLRQDRPRSILALYKHEHEQKSMFRHEKKPPHPPLAVPSSWAEATRTYCWRARAAAWDAAEHDRKEREWGAAREAERQKELALAEALRKIAQALLDLPVLREVIKRDHNGQEIAWLLIPEFRAFKAASDMLGQAKHHARAALEMPDKFERQEVNAKVEEPVEVSPLVKLTPAERLERILAITRQIPATRRGEGENNHELKQ